MKICNWCGEWKEVYACKEVDYEEVENLDKDALLIEGTKPLKDDDVVGLPICKECHDEITGVGEAQETHNHE